MGQDDLNDLETTMRHGLEELANDAPRGEGLWETTTSMIAIEVEPEEEDSPVAAPLLPSSPDRRGLLPTTPPADAPTVRRGDGEC
jgi:hypothetical protein